MQWYVYLPGNCDAKYILVSSNKYYTTGTKHSPKKLCIIFLTTGLLKPLYPWWRVGVLKGLNIHTLTLTLHTLAWNPCSLLKMGEREGIYSRIIIWQKEVVLEDSHSTWNQRLDSGYLQSDTRVFSCHWKPSTLPGPKALISCIPRPTSKSTLQVQEPNQPPTSSAFRVLTTMSLAYL